MGAIVFVKHSTTEKEYMFAVPVHLCHVEKGDTVVVDTMYGREVGVVTTHLVECQNIEEVAVKCGAYLPLKEVVEIVDPKVISYIEKRCKADIAKKLLEGNDD